MSKQDKTSLFPMEFLEKLKADQPKYYIGLDGYDNKVFSYCLVQKFTNGPMTVLLCKNFTNKSEWTKEVSNLQKYFDATIYE